MFHFLFMNNQPKHEKTSHKGNDIKGRKSAKQFPKIWWELFVIIRTIQDSVIGTFLPLLLQAIRNNLVELNWKMRSNVILPKIVKPVHISINFYHSVSSRNSRMVDYRHIRDRTWNHTFKIMQDENDVLSVLNKRYFTT